MLDRSQPNGVTQRFGSYCTAAVLGAGAMGIVYLARDVDTGQRVALKTVRLPDAAFLSGIRREIRALAQISHPGVVRIVAEGVQNGCPWYAMELLVGRTLRQLFAAAPLSGGASATASWWTRLLSGEHAGALLASAAAVAVPRAEHADAERGPRSLRALRRLCATLAYLHGEGIVHRDLKPENVVLREDGTPVLVDFGLMWRLAGAPGREALGVEGAMIGTVEYMAPEQIRGDAVDARADLYALGCMLHEAATGEHPFARPSSFDTLRAHLHEPIPVMVPRRPGIPEGLGDLVRRLLQKEPARRLGYAEDVGRILGALGVDAGWPGALPRPCDYLYRPVLVGRDGMLAALRKDFIEPVGSGAGGLLLIGGETGVGKTRLCAELGRDAERLRFLVSTGECEPPWLSADNAADRAAGGALHPLRRTLQAVADRCRERGARETERLLGERAPILADYEPVLHGLPHHESAAEPVPLPSAAARLRVFSYLTATLARLAEETPLLLVIDDLQWADDLTAGWLDYLARDAAAIPPRLLVVGTFRTEEVTGELRSMISMPGVCYRDLGRLAPREIAAMAATMLAVDAPPEAFVDFLARHSEGNPFFVAEYLRNAVTAGILRRDTEGTWCVSEREDSESSLALYESLPLPSTLRDLVHRRLSGLAAAALRVARLAAALGRESPTVLLLQCADLGETGFLDALTELLRRQVLELTERGDLRFVHDTVREVTYQGVPLADRVDLHCACAEAAEHLLGGDLAEHYGELAHHWARGGHAARAACYYLLGARQACRRHALADAERCYRAFLELAGMHESDAVAARIELARDVLMVRGSGAEAVRVCRAALAEARARGDPELLGRALDAMTVMLRDTGDVGEAESVGREGLALFEASGDVAGKGVALGNLAGLMWAQGRLAEARELYVDALAIHRAVGARRYEGITLGNLAVIAADAGDFVEGTALFEAALPVLRSVDGRREEAIALANLGAIRHFRGQMADAATLYGEALGIQRAIGDRRSEGITLGNLASVLKDQGRVAVARETFGAALRLHREARNRQFEAITLSNMGDMDRQDGNLTAARALLGAALELHRAVGDRLNEVRTLCRLARVERWRAAASAACQDSGLALAEHFLEEAQALLTGQPNPRGEVRLHCERGHLALARGRDASPDKERAHAAVARGKVAADNDVSRALDRLAQALADTARGQALFAGESRAGVPPALLGA
ncbi:MAG: tetratricopeptide repeat protein [Candidatus Schekmanbacteria bacterium]|nr:tetratricopeptide repeat protein [Candidatus Schekmanbacteria bacterium]